ncbi:MAG: DUF29 domain-containing protein [Acetobacteraceae bacterium]|nr:DUF29 domain-containing protein [Acetobacteraceae bacterium]
MPDGARLYEEDFFAWTQDQAARLRALPPEARGNGLDVEHLAEEIEDMGKRDRRSAMSRLRMVLVHLRKLAASATHEPRGHWRGELRGFRRGLEVVLEDSPSLRRYVADQYPDAWNAAVREAADALEAFGDVGGQEMIEAMSDTPFDLTSQVLNPDWYPPYPR